MYEEVTVTPKTPSKKILGNEKTATSDEPTAASAPAQDNLLPSQEAHVEETTAANGIGNADLNGNRSPIPDGTGDATSNRCEPAKANGEHAIQNESTPPQTAPDETPATASSDSGEASPSASPASLADESPDPNDLESLRRELKELRLALLEQKTSEERTEREYREFLELYPDQSVSEMPDDVRESLRQGVPLAAAFALSERRRARIEERAREVNQANQARSLETIRAERNGYFTPEEVRLMSPEEVARYYGDIRSSMQKWS
jgi:hypothetical protein